MRKSNKQPHPFGVWHLVLGGIIALGFLSVIAQHVGQQVGQMVGEGSKARLSVVWPDVMALPTSDRGVLAMLALTCKLTDMPMPVGRDAVIACLRDAVPRMPPDGKVDWLGDLERLIREAPASPQDSPGPRA